ncbi:hypothetical protein DC094_16870 [Pelagibaculum spongiae]|uniref:Uncharacterized protein n=1 Tax=Pelagibaculum spongiae TaxID=2080658 RepID=A0A2V1GTM1_9GAMM|nr:hypothetical protein DC094_16870 [Pelagibaculum spongiae]
MTFKVNYSRDTSSPIMTDHTILIILGGTRDYIFDPLIGLIEFQPAATRAPAYIIFLEHFFKEGSIKTHYFAGDQVDFTSFSLSAEEQDGYARLNPIQMRPLSEALD